MNGLGPIWTSESPILHVETRFDVGDLHYDCSLEIVQKWNRKALEDDQVNATNEIDWTRRTALTDAWADKMTYLQDKAPLRRLVIDLSNCLEHNGNRSCVIDWVFYEQCHLELLEDKITAQDRILPRYMHPEIIEMLDLPKRPSDPTRFTATLIGLVRKEEKRWAHELGFCCQECRFRGDNKLCPLDWEVHLTLKESRKKQKLIESFGKDTEEDL